MKSVSLQPLAFGQQRYTGNTGIEGLDVRSLL